MQKLVWQNANGVELDLTSENYGITEWEGFSNTSLNIQSQQVPFQDGGVFLDALMEQRELSVTLAMQDRNNLELRYQQRRELISALNPKLGEGYLIYTNDYISKRIKCVPQIPLFETHNSDTVGTPKASLSWTACSPYWEDLEETEVEINQNNKVTIENVGDVPVSVKMEIESGAVNPSVVNFRNGKLLSLKYNCNNKVFVDTNVGQKKIYGGNIALELLEGGTVYDILYIEGNTFILVGTSIWLYNKLTETLEVVSEIENTLKKVIFANNLYVAIGNNGAIFTSSDGRNWESRTSGTTTYLNSIIYADGKFLIAGGYYQTSGVATPSSGVILSSTDGITWVNTGSLSNIAMSQILYVEGTGYFVTGMIAETWSGQNVNTGCIYYSTNLTSWSRVYYNLSQLSTNTTITGIAYGNNKFFAVCSDAGHGDNSKILSSTNGTSWSVSQSISNKLSEGIIFANNTFIVRLSSKGILISANGINWTEKTLPQTSVLAYTNNKYFNIYTSVYYSSDLDDWTLMKKIGVDYSIREVVSVQNKCFGISSSNTVRNGVLISEDGINWNYQDLGYTTSHITYINGLIIVTTSQSIILTSTDGTTWEEHTTNMSISYDIIYADGKYLTYKSRSFYTSTDLETWEAVAELDVNVRDFAYSEELNLYAIITTGNAIETSTDLINWNTQTSGIENNLFNIYCENNLFIILGEGEGIVLTSPDGINWSLQNRGISTDWGQYNVVRYINSLYILAGLGTVYVSYDCSSWEEVNPYTTQSLYDITYIGSRYVFVGSALVVSVTDENNLISYLSKDSDMTFNLECGENIINYIDENNKTLLLSYRNKYIGV